MCAICQMLNNLVVQYYFLSACTPAHTDESALLSPLSQRLVKTLVAESPLTAVDFMPDGATLAIGSSRGKIYQYDLRMLKSPVKTISAHKTSVQCIAFQCATALSKVRVFFLHFWFYKNKKLQFKIWELYVVIWSIVLFHNFYMIAFQVILVRSYLILNFKTFFLYLILICLSESSIKACFGTEGNSAPQASLRLIREKYIFLA